LKCGLNVQFLQAKNFSNAPLLFQRSVKKGAQKKMPTTTIEVPVTTVIASPIALLLIPLVLSYSYGFGVVQSYILSAVRAFLQLSFLCGVILTPLFQESHLNPGCLGYMVFMITIGAIECCDRLSLRPAAVSRKIFFAEVLLAVSLGATVTIPIFVALLWSSKYFEPDGVVPDQLIVTPTLVIPVFGMLLGNSTTAVSLAMTSYFTQIKSTAQAINVRFSVGGGTISEATAVVRRTAAMAALNSSLNQMSIAGLVSLPGMMTGQILAGQSPLQSGRYQVLILFGIGGSALLSVIFAIALCERHCFDAVRGQIVGVTSTTSNNTKRKQDILIRLLSFLWKSLRRCFCCDNDSPAAEGYTTVGSGAELELENDDVESNYGSTGKTTKQLLLTTNNKSRSELSELPVLRINCLFDSAKLFRCSDLQINEGEIIVIVGPSGCGKSVFTTSLINQNSRVEPENRDIEVRDFDGSIGTNLHYSTLRSIIAFVPQDLPHLSDTTAAEFFREITGYKSQLKRSKVKGHVRMERFLANAKRLDLDVTDVCDKSLANLSGGMRQRVFLAMVFSLDFRCIVLDEPTSALDEKCSRKVEELILQATKREEKRTTVIMTTHDMAQKDRMADRVIDMN